MLAELTIGLESMGKHLLQGAARSHSVCCRLTSFVIPIVYVPSFLEVKLMNLLLDEITHTYA